MQKLIVIYIRYVKEILSLSAREQLPHEQRTIEFYEDIPVCHTDINDDCSRLFEILNSTGRETKVNKAILESVKYIGQSLFDKLCKIKGRTLKRI